MTTEQSTKLAKLRDLLRELFQLDQADLDFGIYRIMNQKRDEVERFLDDDLLPQVRAAFEKYRPADKAALQAELDKTLADLSKYGVDPESNDAVLDLRKRLAQGVDVAALEDEVFSDLFTFFRRYYHGGDFLSLRRYKEGVYAIPYEGEEVKLHWANHDQYYIKSSEHLTNYAFKVGQRRVRFELVAAGAERDNNKAQNGNERRFIVADEDPVIEDGGELVVRFEYRPDADKRKQDALNVEAAASVLAAAPAAWKDALSRKVPTKASPDRTVLDQHIRSYTAKNTFDYFIHKDLGGFLRRELDFFIKNEILLLDDIDQVADFAKVEEKLSKIRVLRAIAHKVIAFLGQLEDFQKKLWLKKKFVVETNWCITLDRIPEKFYPEIAANEAQREEWVHLFAINEIEGDMVTAGYSVPLSVEFIKAHGALVVDTLHRRSKCDPSGGGHGSPLQRVAEARRSVRVAACGSALRNRGRWRILRCNHRARSAGCRGLHAPCRPQSVASARSGWGALRVSEVRVDAGLTISWVGGGTGFVEEATGRVVWPSLAAFITAW